MKGENKMDCKNCINWKAKPKKDAKLKRSFIKIIAKRFSYMTYISQARLIWWCIENVYEEMNNEINDPQICAAIAGFTYRFKMKLT